MKVDQGVKAVHDNKVKVIGVADKSDMNQNVIEACVPISNRFDILSTKPASSVPRANMHARPTTAESETPKKYPTCIQSDLAISTKPVSCPPPRSSPSFTPPGTPPSTSRSKKLEEDIKEAIRGLSLW